MNRDEAIEELKCAIELIKQNGKDWIDERDIPVFQTAIEALERNRGEWVKAKNEYYVFECSECGKCSDLRHNYCPNCGADMRKEVNSDG